MNALNQFKRFLFALALVSYVGITLFGVIHIAHMAHSGMPMQDCPFAMGEHSLCAMNAVEHIKAWQEFTTTLLPTIKALVLASVVITFVFLTYHSPPITRFLLYRRREWQKIVSLYQQLFSRGILNPKAP